MEMGDFFRTRPIWRCLVNWAPDLQLVCAEITFSMQISAAYHRHVFFLSLFIRVINFQLNVQYLVRE